MKKTIMLASCVFAGISFLGACTSEAPKTPTSTPTPAASPSVSPVGSPAGSPTGSPAGSPGASKANATVGKWPGVEGTSLNITKKGEKYTIEIANLDGPKTFEGSAKGDGIEFSRGGKTETIKTATGDETGMKHFAGKKECLVVTKGSEGFCRK